MRRSAENMHTTAAAAADITSRNHPMRITNTNTSTTKGSIATPIRQANRLIPDRTSTTVTNEAASNEHMYRCTAKRHTLCVEQMI